MNPHRSHPFLDLLLGEIMNPTISATVVRFFGSLNYPKFSKSVTGLTEGPGSVNERKPLAQFPHPQPHHSEGSPEWAGLGPPGAG